MKYDVSKLYVVPKGEYNFICKYDKKKQIFTEVLTGINIDRNEVFMVGRLKDYYFGTHVSLDKPMFIDEKEILKESLLLNQKQIKKDCDISEFLKCQEKKIKQFENLKQTNPELAKKIATEELKSTGILDDKGEIRPPYDKVFVKKKDK